MTPWMGSNGPGGEAKMNTNEELELNKNKVVIYLFYFNTSIM